VANWADRAAEWPRPSGEGGGGERLVEKKNMGRDWAKSDGKIIFWIKFDFWIYQGFGNL
jgi:hypothetical protein